MCNHQNRERVCAEQIKNKQVCKCIHVIEINLNDLVEFVIVDATRSPLPVPLTTKHPMHLHGHKFAVLAMHEVNHALFFQQIFKKNVIIEKSILN